MQKTQRNTEAETFKTTLIPKDSMLIVGIKGVDVFKNTIPSGDHKGREYDKYKTTLVVLEAGEFKGSTVKVSVSARTERRTDGAGNVVIDNYGNSGKYAELLKAIDPSIKDDALPMPESDEEAKEWGQTWCGNVLQVTFGVYTFKNDKGEEIKINTLKEALPLTEDQIEALKADISIFKAEVAADQGAGAADSFDPDELV